MNIESEKSPIVEADGELVQADTNVNLNEYNAYVKNFRPRPMISTWVEWDTDRIISTGCFVVVVVTLAACFMLFYYQMVFA